MRTDRYGLKCSACPAYFSMENGGTHLSNNLRDVMERAATYVGWFVGADEQLCLLHRPAKEEGCASNGSTTR